MLSIILHILQINYSIKHDIHISILNPQGRISKRNKTYDIKPSNAAVGRGTGSSIDVSLAISVVKENVKAIRMDLTDKTIKKIIVW